MIEECSPEKIWSPADDLSTRVRKLREEYFNFSDRDYFRNEVRPYTTGTAWDLLWSPYHWGIVPEVFEFIPAFRDSLRAAAEQVPLPKDFWDHSRVLRRATFFRRVIERHLPAQILDGELIVGGPFNTALSTCLNQEEAREYQKLVNQYFKEDKTLDRCGIGNAGAVPGHIIPDYPMVLQLGFGGIIENLRNKLSSVYTQEHKDQLLAMIECCEAAIHYSRRFAKLASAMAAAASDAERQTELYEISRICAKVPEQPAQTFWEALQSLWFAHSLVMASEGYPGPGLSHGRVDQYLYPYYRNDKDNGKLSDEWAAELLLCYWIKHNYVYDYQAKVGKNQGIFSGFGQLVTLSGIGSDGTDSTNELTYLMLDVIERINMLEPKPNVRLHKGSPDRLLKKVCSMISKAQGAPFLLNFDENAIEGMIWQGVPKEKAWDYAPVGCLENTLQGNDRSGTVDVNLNLAKAVELALNRGKCAVTGEQLGPRTGDPRTFKTFDEFYVAVKKQLDAIMERLCKLSDLADEIRSRFEPTPYLSAIVRGCADSGKDITAGGAEHNYITVEGVALATAVDSLLAVRHLVFEEKKIGMDELLTALGDNFEGHDKIAAQLRAKAPKFGNDDSRADDLARDFSTYWSSKIFSRTSPATGRRYRGGYLSWNYWIAYADKTGPTPDGRPKGRFLANGICPVNGTDRYGPTAVIRSIGKLNLYTTPNGASHTMSFSPSLIRDNEHLDKLAGLLRAYAKEGGTALQVNVLDANTLRAAQVDPETYRNLLVRVTGYNAYFVMLGKEIQDEIIARHAHEL